MSIKSRVLSFFIVFLLFLPSFHAADQLVSSPNDLNSSLDELSYYGFIIPVPSETHTTQETVTQSRIFFLINDLLRENISVAWIHEEKTIKCSLFPWLNSSLNKTIHKGDFFVPFTGNIEKDVRIITILSDYCFFHELDSQAEKISSYAMYENIDVNVTFLSEPRIAQHFGTPTRYGWPCYLLMAEAAGFFSFDFLLDDETASQLSNERYNVFMWPYEPDPASPVEVLQSLSNKKGCQRIRDFVRNGGGFIGSCYGALVASSGFPNPFSPVHLLASKIPFLRCPPASLTLCLSDSLMNERPKVLENLYQSTSLVCTNQHPVTYNMNHSVHEFFSGPWFVSLGKKTKSLAFFSTVETRNQDESPAFIQRQVVNSPSWVCSQFGKGSMVLFASHPEFVNNISFLFQNRSWPGDPYYGRRVIYNSLFHVVSDDSLMFSPQFQQNSSFLSMVFQRSHFCLDDVENVSLFSESVQKISCYEQLLRSLQNKTEELQQLYQSDFDQSLFFKSSSRPLLYTYHFSDILLNYCQKTKQCLQQLSRLALLIDTVSFHEEIMSFQEMLLKELRSAETVAQEMIFHSKKAEMLFAKPNVSFFDKYQIVSQTREMITTLEISLKHVPALFFESSKTLRHQWYDYEVSQIC
ncbi:MAG: hypothetical protein R6U21_02795 [Thermoplasmatota archaeon]